jgi:hypothetical protein
VSCPVNDYRKYESTCVSQHSASRTGARFLGAQFSTFFLKKRKEAEKERMSRIRIRK